jgi:hypothetical protein
LFPIYGKIENVPNHQPVIFPFLLGEIENGIKRGIRGSHI